MPTQGRSELNLTSEPAADWRVCRGKGMAIQPDSNGLQRADEQLHQLSSRISRNKCSPRLTCHMDGKIWVTVFPEPHPRKSYNFTTARPTLINSLLTSSL